MANTFLKPGVIAAVGLETLRRELVLPRLVRRMGVSDFAGAVNDTVNVRVPAILTAREYTFRTRSAEIVLDEVEELSVPVTLDKHIYSAVAVTDEELTLDIVDFTRQVLGPQMIAVAERLEGLLATTMEGATLASDPVAYIASATNEGAGFYNALVDARRILNAAKVPLTGRSVVIGSNVEAAALKEESIRAVDQSGSPDALRRANLGSLAGFDNIVVSQSVDADFAMAFHSSAFAFAVVAPAVPQGASFGQGITDSGLAMRWLKDYDARYLRDRSVVSAFAGSASVEDGRDPDDSDGQPGALNDTNIRAVKIEFTPAGS